MANEQNLTNMGKGRPRGSRNKIRVNDVITDARVMTLLEELYSIATTDEYPKNRLTAIGMLLERTLGKVPTEITQTNIDGRTVSDLLKNKDAANTQDNNENL